MEVSHIRTIMASRASVSVLFLAQIVTRTRVRMDWLMWGNGAMLDGGLDVHDNPGALDLPLTLATSFTAFSTVQNAVTTMPAMAPASAHHKSVTAATPEHVQAARAIHASRGAARPVMLFAGPDAIAAGVGILAVELLEKKYVTALATTGAGMARDVRMAYQSFPVDLNYVAQLAAKHGVGYGEAIGRWGMEPSGRRRNSALYVAHQLGIPATVHVEIGELPQHLFPAARGAELGAAIGAATYVDFLIFTEQVQELRAGGVLITTGDVLERSWRLLRTALLAQQQPATAFTVIAIDSSPSVSVIDDIKAHGGAVCVLPGPYRGNVYNLRKTCDDVFSGATTHDGANEGSDCASNFASKPAQE